MLKTLQAFFSLSCYVFQTLQEKLHINNKQSLISTPFLPSAAKSWLAPATPLSSLFSQLILSASSSLLLFYFGFISLASIILLFFSPFYFTP
jgi:hypothetical protein